MVYKDGKNEPPKGDRSINLFRKAVGHGVALVQLQLGIMYANGKFGSQDDAEAVKWYRKAAEQGVAKAQLYMGFMYSNGQGVPQDYVLAHMWYNLSASQGNKIGQKNRNKIAERMTPSQIAEAQKMARKGKSAFYQNY